MKILRSASCSYYLLQIYSFGLRALFDWPWQKETTWRLGCRWARKTNQCVRAVLPKAADIVSGLGSPRGRGVRYLRVGKHLPIATTVRMGVDPTQSLTPTQNSKQSRNAANRL